MSTQRLRVGDVVRVVEMRCEDPVPPGTVGLVTAVYPRIDGKDPYGVQWQDTTSTRWLLVPPDRVEPATMWERRVP